MGMIHRFDVRTKSSPSARFMMLGIVVVWIAISLDTLESFSPTISPCCTMHVEQRSPTSLLSSTMERHAKDDSSPTEEEKETTPTDITISLPSFAADPEASFPSPLHHLYVRSLLSDEEVGMALKLAIDYAEENGRFDNPDSDRHVSYATCDFPVDECDQLDSFLESTDFQSRLFDQFADLYCVDADDLTFDDLFVAYYQAKPKVGDTADGDNDGDQEDDESSNIMDRLELHRDGSLFSFSLLLNPPDEFDGGGTFYDALRDVNPSDSDHGILHAGGAIRPERAGDAVLHCGKILHGADVVTEGRRVVLVGFVELSKRCIRKGVIGNACKEWGRQDVARYRYQRQEKKKHKGWVLSNSRWLSNASNARPSVVRGFVPASSGVVRRANPEGCRLRRLQTENSLLQNILLLPEERGPKEDEYHFPFEEVTFDDDGSVSSLPEFAAE